MATDAQYLVPLARSSTARVSPTAAAAAAAASEPQAASVTRGLAFDARGDTGAHLEARHTAAVGAELRGIRLIYIVFACLAYGVGLAVPAERQVEVCQCCVSSV